MNRLELVVEKAALDEDGDRGRLVGIALPVGQAVGEVIDRRGHEGRRVRASAGGADPVLPGSKLARVLFTPAHVRHQGSMEFSGQTKADR